MRYYPRLKLFKANNNTFDGTEARSYGWYVYALKLSNGDFVETTHRYSPTTSQHMHDFHRLLNYAPIKYSILAPRGLNNLDDAVVAIKGEIKRLKGELKNKRNRNIAQREAAIVDFENQLKTIKMIKADQKKTAKKNNQM